MSGLDILGREIETARKPLFRPTGSVGPVESFRIFSWENYRSGKIGVDSANRLHLVMRLSGRVDLEALARAFDLVVVEHSALSTRVSEIGGRPWLRFEDPPRLEMHGAGSQGNSSSHVELISRVREYVWFPFDLDRDTLSRAAVFMSEQNEIIFVIVVHHLVCDAVSLRLLWSDIWRHYIFATRGGAVIEKPKAINYRDYLVAIREWRSTATASRRLEDWCSDLLTVASKRGQISHDARRAGREGASLTAWACL